MQRFRFLIALLGMMPLFLQAQNLDYLDRIHFGDGPGLNDEVFVVVPYNNGDILTTGRLRGLIDFDIDSNTTALVSQPGGNTAGSYIARYGKSGQLRWVKSVSGSGSAQIIDATMDDDENIYITGYFSARMTFPQDNNPQTFFGFSPNNANGYVAKLDTTGNLMWIRFFMGNSVDMGRRVRINSQNQVIVLGHVSQTVVFDSLVPNSTVISAGFADIFIAAYNANNGDFSWVSPIPGGGVDNSRGMELDSDDNIYISGDFTGTINFPTTPPSPTPTTGGNDVFAAKASPTGDFLWARKIGGTSTDMGADLKLSGDTVVFVNGTYRFNIQFDHGGSTPSFTSPNSNVDVFMAAYDTSGSYLWNVRAGSNSADNAGDMMVDDSARVWMSGRLLNAGDLDPGVGTAMVNTNNAGNPFAAAYDIQNGAFSRLIAPQAHVFGNTQALALGSNGDIWTGGWFRGDMTLDSASGFSLFSRANNIASSYWARHSSGFDTAWTTISRGGGTNDEAKRVRHDQSGNIYVCGKFSGRVDFNPNGTPQFLSAADETDAFVASYTQGGMLRWAHRFGGTGEDDATALAVDHQGNVLVGGQFHDDIVLPTGSGFDTITALPSGIFNRPNIFKVKLDSSGNAIYGYRIGGTNVDMINDIVFYPNGDYLIGGNFAGGMDFDPALVGNGTYSGNNSVGYFAKYSAGGQYQWSKLINGSSNQYVNALAIDDSLNILVTGAHRNTTNFDLPNTFMLTSNGGSNDVFIAKYDSVANLKWVNSYGLTPSTFGRGVAVDENGHVYVTGEFTGSTDFNPGGTPNLITSNGGVDVFVASIHRDGNMRWIVPFGGSQDDRPRDLQLWGSRIFTVGEFFETVDFGSPNDTVIRESRGGRDVFVHVLDTSGSFVNASTFGGPGQEYGWSLTHFNGKTFVGGQGGRFTNLSPTNFPIILNEFASLDGIVVKLGNAGPCPPEFDTIIATECGRFSWNNETFTETGTYTRQLFTVNGCDSTIFLDLTIHPEYDTIFEATTCALDFSWMGQTLTTSGMYVDTLSTLNGCDSIIRLDLELLPVSFDTVQQTACEEYTWPLNNETYTQSGLYADTLQNTNGCDSIVTLNLIINPATSDSVNITACEQYIWSLNNQTYTQSGTYLDTLQNINGCDSIVTLHLTINLPTSGSETVTACEAYTWPVSNQTYTQSGNYVDTIQNANGCDSIVTLHLTINDVDVSVTDSVLSLTATATGATFQWLDCQDNFNPIPGATAAVFSPTVNGEYAVEVSQNNCVDTSSCYLIYQIGVVGFDLTDIRIFPIPNTGQFTIDLGKIYAEYTIRITDAKGQTVRLITGINKQFIEQQLHVAAGVYMVEVYAEGKRAVERLVVM